MFRLGYYSLLLLALSCTNKTENKTSKHKTQVEFKLIDSLGMVAINFPERADTFFSWIQRSDCGKPCEHGDYRFQSKSNRIFKESGWYWIGEPEDSVEQLSIYHQRVDTIVKFNDSLIFKFQNFLLEKQLSDPRTSDVLSDTFIKIADRNFYVLRVAGYDWKKGVRERRLIAFTTVSGALLEFQYKLMTKTYDSILTHFFDRSLENLKTVRLKDGS